MAYSTGILMQMLDIIEKLKQTVKEIATVLVTSSLSEGKIDSYLVLVTITWVSIQSYIYKFGRNIS